MWAGGSNHQPTIASKGRAERGRHGRADARGIVLNQAALSRCPRLTNLPEINELNGYDLRVVLNREQHWETTCLTSMLV